MRQGTIDLPDDLLAKIEAVKPERMPAEVIQTLIAYYAANRLEDSEWVVLPVANFDCWFGDTNNYPEHGRPTRSGQAGQDARVALQEQWELPDEG